MISVRRLWIMICLSFVFLRLTLANLWGLDNRFYAHWHRTDSFAVILAILVVALFLWICYEVSGLFGGRFRYVRDIGFGVFSIFYLKIALVEVIFPEAAVSPWFSVVTNVLAAMVVVVLVVRRERVIRLLDSALLILSPIVPIFIGTLLMSPTVSSSHGHKEWTVTDKKDTATDAVSDGLRGQRQNAEGVRRAYIFLFDSLSFQRTFQGGLSQNEFPNLWRVSKESICFSMAYSTGNSTYTAVPGMLCGAPGAFELSGEVPVLCSENGSFRIADLPNLFGDMKQRGMATELYGIGPPYSSMFSKGLDTCESREVAQFKIYGEGIWQVARAILTQHIGRRLGWLHPSVDRWYRRAWRNGNADLQGWVHSNAVAVIKKGGPEFAFFHYMLPHWPRIYDRSGLLPIEHIRSRGGEWNESAYLGNAHYADTVIGELLDTLRASPDYEHTLFIIVADHTERSDPTADPNGFTGKKRLYEQCRVPLLIHLPGQRNAATVDTPFSTLFLRQILVKYTDQAISLEEFVRSYSGYAESDIRCWFRKE